MNFSAIARSLSPPPLARVRNKIGSGKKTLASLHKNMSHIDGNGVWQKGPNERYGPEDIRRLEKERGIRGPRPPRTIQPAE